LRQSFFVNLMEFSAEFLLLLLLLLLLFASVQIDVTVFIQSKSKWESKRKLLERQKLGIEFDWIRSRNGRVSLIECEKIRLKNNPKKSSRHLTNDLVKTQGIKTKMLKWNQPRIDSNLIRTWLNFNQYSRQNTIVQLVGIRENNTSQIKVTTLQVKVATSQVTWSPFAPSTF